MKQIHKVEIRPHALDLMEKDTHTHTYTKE